MDITLESINNWVVASLHGAFTIKDTSEIQVLLEEVLENDHPLLAFDISQVPFLDSSAIGSIISAKKQLNQKGGYICLFGANEVISDIFETVRLAKHITLYVDRDEFIAKT